MKKKRLKLVTTIALLAALAGGSGGVAWGQAYKKGYVTSDGRAQLRRGDATSLNSRGYIGLGKDSGHSNINNEFGAGESSVITNGSITWPASNGVPHSTPSAIQIGSEYSENILINSFNAGGYAAGWINLNIYSTACGGGGPATAYAWIDGTQHTLKPGQTYAATTVNGMITPHMTLSSQSSDLHRMGGILSDTAVDYRDSVVLYLVRHQMTASAASPSSPNYNLGRYRFRKWAHTSPYTSTGVWDDKVTVPNIDMYIDDGIKLVLTGGSRMFSDATASVASVGTAPIPSASNNTAYRRPTTVSVDGGTFSQIRFTPVKWWYRRYHVGGSETGGSTVTYNTGSPMTIPSVYDCCHFEAHLSNVVITDPRNWVNESQIATGHDSEEGATQVDAAVQLLAGARVCVTGNVEDATGNIGESASQDPATAYAHTNAVIVLPDTVRFTLRTKGNFKANMIHSKDSVDTRNAFYSAADFPQVNTTPGQENIWLWGSNTSDKQAFGRTLHEFQRVTVPFHNKGDRTPTTTVDRKSVV